MALFYTLFVLMVCCVVLVSANGILLCSKGTKETREAEGDIEFPSASVETTVGICEVNIYYPREYEIELTLVNVIKETNWCGGDYIEIIELRRAKYCISINSHEGNKETLVLKTNAITVRRFRPLTSNLLLAHPSSKVSVTVHYKMRKPCRYFLTGQTGTFHSPSYPSFSKNLECEWIITTHPGTTIQLKFEPVELSINCNTSYVEVNDGTDQPISIICGKYQIRSIQSKSSKLWIRLKSTTNSVVRFKATYKAISSCRRVHITEPSDFQPHRNEQCVTWVLTAPIGQIAVLSLSKINLHSTSRGTSAKSCFGNVVKVWNGESITVYCNSNLPPTIIRSLNGHTLTVTYRLTDLEHASDTFYGNFATVSPNNYKASCFVENMELYFKCGDHQQISCNFQCDGAMQCPDNSDEEGCSEMDTKWQQLQIFVIVMASMCALTITFCVGIVCFRKYISRNNGTTNSYGRQSSTSDQAPLTPNPELPSPPPRYFNDNDNAPPSIIRGTYFFGNEFSQNEIHSASLFGIPPPRYRSRESLQLVCPGSNEGNGHRQEEMMDMASRQISICGGETQTSQGEQFVSGASSAENIDVTSTEDVPLVNYCSLPDEAKEDTKLTNTGIENEAFHQEMNENSQAATTNSDQIATDFVNTIPGTNVNDDSDTCNLMYV